MLPIDWNFIFSIITVLVAIFALIQTHKQIQISNKQHLFDKRVETNLIAVGLLELCKENKGLIDKMTKDDYIDDIDVVFIFLTNNSYLEKCAAVVLDSKDNDNTEKKVFLTMMENLKSVAAKIRYLFKKEAAELLSEFVLHYQELLMEMYQYNILMTNISDYNKKQIASNGKQAKGQDELYADFDEKKYRDNLRKAAIILQQDYEKLTKENIKEQIEKQIKF